MRQNKRLDYKSKYTKDHLISLDKWGTGCEENIHWKKRAEHRWKHEYLWTKLFHQQILSIIEENKTTLLPEAIQVMDKIKADFKLLLENEKLYKNKCFKYWKKPKTL